MTNIKYYPLIDCDSEGMDKVPMFFSKNEAAVRKNHGMYLKKIVSKYYRLCSVGGVSAEDTQRHTIHCLYCGKTMKQIALPKSTHRLGLYCCPDCNLRKRGITHE